MEKLTEKDGKTPDLVQENIAGLKQLFPEVFIDGRIDFDALKETLGSYVDEREERYSFTWHGKSRARRIAQTPSTGTLLPCKEDSVNWDSTQNIFIEGDNLEVLKLLQKSYHRKVKMIYIDPPYNTGKEFIYPDKWQDNLDTYLRYTGQIDDEGFKTTTNTETSGRYHTNWLNMMYPRLKLARNLLREDGVIFVSISDHESHNLRSLMDEVFGPENFVCQFVWNTEGHTDNQYDVKVNHEYIQVYRRSEVLSLGYVIDPNTREESNLWKGLAENSITKNGSANPPSEVTLPVGFPVLATTLDLPANVPPSEFFVQVENLGYITRTLTQQWSVEYPIRLDAMECEGGKLTKPCRVFSGWANVNKLKMFIAGGCRPICEDDGSVLSFYLSARGVIYYRRDRDKARNIVSVLRNLGTTERMRSELEAQGVPFQYPKPKELLVYLIKIGAPDGGLVLDFFAGSGTTAAASVAVANESELGLRFILVQLPEYLKPEDSKLRPAIDFCESMGVSHTVAEITKQRLRRTLPEPNGFRVFKLSSSNVKLWDSDFENIDGDLFDAVENIKPERSEHDVLYELILKYGLDLAVPVDEESISGRTVFIIGAGALIVCLADSIDLDVVHGIAALIGELSPAACRVVFKDSGFGSDVDKTNAVQILKHVGVNDVKSL